MPMRSLKKTIGRKEELARLFKNFEDGVPTLLLGKAGVGKTRLLKLFSSSLEEKGTPHLYIERFKPVKETLFSVCRAHKKDLLPDELKRLRRLTIPELVEEVILSLKTVPGEKPFVLIFDHLEELTPSTAVTVQKISGDNLVFGGARFIRDSHQLKKFFWQFDIIDVPPFTKDETRLFVEKLIESHGLEVESKDFLINRIAANTSGIPLSIEETTLRLAAKGKITSRDVRDMFIHGSGVKEVDASPFIILIFSLFIVMRFVYRGFGEYQGYALFGALTGVGMFVRYLIGRQGKGGEKA